MADRDGSELDRALARLAERERRAHPRPGPDLAARVLADAAAEAARSAASRPDPARPGALARLLERALARAAGPRLAGAMLLLALLGGLGAGYATAPGPSAAELALLGPEDEDTLALAAFGAAEPF